MARKPEVPKVGPPGPGRGSDKGLAVKDSLREVRFNMKLGARKLVQAVEAATHRHDADTPGHPGPRGPLSLLGEPLNLAVRTTATLLSTVDHAAVDLLSSDGPYRAMTAPLRSSVAHFHAPQPPGDLRAFATDHLWRYRHWLALTQRPALFVHEQALAMAGAQVADAQPTGDSTADDDGHLRTAVRVIQALMRKDILSQPSLSHEVDEDQLAALGALGAVVVVLAGEIAPGLQHLAVRDQTGSALRLADEIAMADRASWEAALRSAAPSEALARWLAFVLRHV